ncbi:hypothetical protein GCM10027018_03060 [Paenibacillus thermoaerophilus]
MQQRALPNLFRLRTDIQNRDRRISQGVAFCLPTETPARIPKAVASEKTEKLNESPGMLPYIRKDGVIWQEQAGDRINLKAVRLSP